MPFIENPTIEKIWNDFWKPIVYKDGELDIEQIKKELHDFYHMIDNVPKVYDTVTNSHVSKPLTDSSVVIAIFEDNYCPIDMWEDSQAENERLTAENAALRAENERLVTIVSAYMEKKAQGGLVFTGIGKGTKKV